MSDLDRHLPQIVAGDSRAFGRWVAGAELSLRLDLRRYAAFIDVEAVLQETLLRVWQVAPRFVPDGKPNGLARLAQRISRNLAIDLLRRQKSSRADVELLLDTPSELVIEPAPDPFLRGAVLECKAKLPRKLAAALDARLEAAGSEPDAHLARQLKMRLNTFLQNVTRARKAIAQCLRRAGIDLQQELA